MTRDEAVKMYRAFGLARVEEDFRLRHPAWLADRVADACAEDAIDGLIAIGVLVVDQPKPADPE